MVAMAASVVALVPSLAVAASGHAAESSSSSQWIMLGFTFANFLMFFLLLRHFVRAPLRDFLHERRRKTVEVMAEAARAKQEAEALKQEYEARLAGLEEAKRALLADVRAIAETDRRKALAAAEEAAERLKRDAELMARSDLARARRELQAEAARLARELAIARLQEGLSREQQARLLAEFVAGAEVKR
jgi:F-type H+-transporting ATPase subunit b